MMSSQKEFTFPVASTTNSHRVVRPSKVVPLGKALEKNALSDRRNNSGTTSSMSISSQSRSSRESASTSGSKYQLAPTHNSSSSLTASAILRRQERRQQSAADGKAIEPLPGGSFHASFNHHYTSKSQDNDDDSFGADDNDAEWWDDNGGTSEQMAGRKSTKVQKVKVKAQEFFKGSGSGNHHGHGSSSNLKNGNHGSSSSLNRSGAHQAPPESSRRLDQALSRRGRPEHTSDDKSVQSSQSRLRSKTPQTRGVTRSKSANPGPVAVPRGSLLGRSAADDEDDNDGLPPSPSRVIRRARGRSVETRSKTSLPMGGRSRSKKRVNGSGASVASAASAPQMTATGRVKVGRVSRPGGSSTISSNGLGGGSSVSNRYGFAASSSNRTGSSSTTHSQAFDPFAASEHGHVKASELPLQVQRRGKYNDKETLLRKVKEIGISEHMLQDMKQAGLVITEGKR